MTLLIVIFGFWAVGGWADNLDRTMVVKMMCAKAGLEVPPRP